MIKAIFFDLFNTIIHHDPSPVEQQEWACRKYGVKVSKQDLCRGFWFANEHLTKMNIDSSISRRSSEELHNVWIDYEILLLREAGVEISSELAGQLIADLGNIEKKLVMYTDALPSLELLRGHGLHLGLISNLNKTMDYLGMDTDLTPLFDSIITSMEVGFDKPHQKIFLTALQKANVEPHEAIHVGDQYHSDVLGARAVGIKPLLIDRDGFSDHHTDCERINTLAKIVEHL